MKVFLTGSKGRIGSFFIKDDSELGIFNINLQGLWNLLQVSSENRIKKVEFDSQLTIKNFGNPIITIEKKHRDLCIFPLSK